MVVKIVSTLQRQCVGEDRRSRHCSDSVVVRADTRDSSVTVQLHAGVGDLGFDTNSIPLQIIPSRRHANIVIREIRFNGDIINCLVLNHAQCSVR